MDYRFSDTSFNQPTNLTAESALFENFFWHPGEQASFILTYF